jgi:hypothetical protein
MIERIKSSNMSFNRISTSSMPNVNLIRHNNNTDEHLLHSELSLNVFNYSYIPERTLMVRIYTKLTKLFLRGKKEVADNIFVFMTRDIIIFMA